MNHAEAAAVLAKVQAFDNRTVSAVNVAAWAEALEDVDGKDALVAVTEHFQESTDWLMPSHIIQKMKDKQFQGRQRIKAMGPPDYPTGLTLAEESQYRARFQLAAFRGFTREQAQKDADHEVFGTLAPDGPVDWWNLRNISADELRAAFEGWLAQRELESKAAQKQLPAGDQ